ELDVWADRVAAWGRYVFAVGQDEVVVIDAGNPRQPEPIATIEYDGHYYDAPVRAVPGFLLVRDPNRIWVFDVRDPTEPTVHQTIEDPVCSPWYELEIDIAGGLLVQGGGVCGIQTLDLSECTGPESAPSVNFTTSPPVPSAGDAVRFDNHTSGSPTDWLWDFGDGTTSTVEAPTRVFENPGTYTVSLTATNSHGSSTGSLTFEVLDEPEPPVADFRWAGTELSTRNPVEFFDESTGRPAWWSWDFGDGYRSSESDPIHFYSLPGSYEVTLEVGDGVDASSVTKTITLEAPVLDGAFLLNAVGEVIAAAAAVPGRHNTYWRTDLTVFNPADETRGLWFWFLPRGGQDNRDAALKTWINVHPMQTVTMESVLGNHFGVEDTAGALVTALPNLLTLGSRTFTEAAGGGSFGQAIPSVWTDTMPVGVASQAILGLRQDADFRSNAGFVNLTDRTQWFTATVVAETGDVVEEARLTIGRFGCLQIDRALPTLGESGLDRGTIIIDAPPDEIQAYSSIIDNRTGDAVFIPARCIGLEPASLEWIVPAVASVRGASGTRWRSQLELVNTSSEPAAVTLTLMETGAHAAPNRSHELTVESGRLVRIDDVVEGLFGLRTSGALLISSSAEIQPTSRTWTTSTADASSDGTYGQYVPAVPATELLTSSRPASILDLRENADFRSNVGFANPSSEPATIEVRAFSELGELLATTTVELGPWEHRQDNRFLDTLGGVERATLVLSVQQGAAVAYGSVVDNRTGDPVLKWAVEHGQYVR
ncbi:MAG: PKD domain-containing protein, partial [Thermoanaerobaculales bacterium]|nr:PKD domain-containing protein [Thermoanaerobaculales bacterium]